MYSEKNQDEEEEENLIMSCSMIWAISYQHHRPKPYPEIRYQNVAFEENARQKKGFLFFCLFASFHFGYQISCSIK